MTYFDALETRSADERASDQAAATVEQIKRAASAPGFAAHFSDSDTNKVISADDLPMLPVLRKSDLIRAQAERPLLVVSP